MFAARIVTADYYLCSPVKDLDVCYSEFRGSDVKRVPVVRIFGATPAGEWTRVSVTFYFISFFFPVLLKARLAGGTFLHRSAWPGWLVCVCVCGEGMLLWTRTRGGHARVVNTPWMHCLEQI